MSAIFSFKSGAPLIAGPWLALEEVDGAPGSALQLTVPNTVDVLTLAPLLPRIAAICLDFPAFADGRAYSQARVLRRMGFRGHLRASGKAVVLDQALELRAADFDDAVLRDDQSTSAWADCLAQSPVEGVFTAARSLALRSRIVDESAP